jgi:hypothetical protein
VFGVITKEPVSGDTVVSGQCGLPLGSARSKLPKLVCQKEHSTHSRSGADHKTHRRDKQIRRSSKKEHSGQKNEDTYRPADQEELQEGTLRSEGRRHRPADQKELQERTP